MGNTPIFHPDAPTFHPDVNSPLNPTPQTSPATPAPDVVPHWTGYDPQLRESLESAPGAQMLAQKEATTQKENEHWDALWKTNPHEVWKTNPRKALGYAIHGYLQNKIENFLTNPGDYGGLKLSDEQKQKISQAYKNEIGPNAADELANLVIPKPEETVVKAGVPPMVGGALGEGAELASQRLMGAEEAVPANMRNVTPVEPAPSVELEKIPGVVPVTKHGETANGILTRDALIKKYGTEPVSARIRTEPSFILPNGKVVYLGQIQHPSAIASVPEGAAFAGGEDARTNFINEANTVRVRPNMDAREGETLHFTVPKNGVSPEQVDAMKAAAAQIKRGNLIAETADKPAESRSNLAHPEDWQFKTANDVEKILSDIGVHPDQKPSQKITTISGAIPITKQAAEPGEQPAEPWEQTAAKENTASGGFTIHPQNGIPTEGKIVSILPETEIKLGHPATPEDIRNYYLAHKELFDAHPELHIGGYGDELNVSAIGPYAEDVAKKLDQESIYDLGKKEVIPTGGANKLKNFPDYSLTDRLTDLTGELPIPHDYRDLFSTRGFTWPNVRGHENGHAIFGDLNGLPAKETFSHLHEYNQRLGALATQNTDMRLIGTPVLRGGRETGSFKVDPAKIVQNLQGVLQWIWGGPMVQEVLDGIPSDTNPGAVGDAAMSEKITRMVGLNPEQAQREVELAKESIRNVLTIPKVQDIIRKYREVRERGLDKTLQISAEQNQRMIKEIREAIDEHNSQQRGNGEHANGQSAKPDSGGTGERNAGGEGGNASGTIEAPAIRKEVKGSTIPLLENPLPVKSDEGSLFPEKLHRGVEITNPVYPEFQKAISRWLEKTAGKAKGADTQMQRSISIAHNEINHQIMENGGEGKGWYRRKTDAAIKALTPLHPELSNPAHATIFKALWAAHSYGNDPIPNMDQAEENLTNLEQTGHVEMNRSMENGEVKHWSGHSGNVFTLAKTQHLLDTMGEDEAAKWLTTKHSWQEIKDKFEPSGLNVSKTAIPFDENGKTYGAMAFGPKGGAFFLNLNGINDFTTVDIWGARALRRWEGRAGSPETLEVDPKTGIVNDRPPTTAEIQRFHKIAVAVAGKLKLDTDDVQALQWYYEHELYKAHGVGESARDYEEAAKHVVKQRGAKVNVLDFLNALKKPIVQPR